MAYQKIKRLPCGCVTGGRLKDRKWCAVAEALWESYQAVRESVPREMFNSPNVWETWVKCMSAASKLWHKHLYPDLYKEKNTP